MKKLWKRLFSIKILLSLLIIGIFFSVPVFATETATSGLQNAGIAMNDIVSFLSWAWVFFAVLAGKLMSNDFVYGSFMNLDSFLWQMRNIMKNFANFTIGFLFLFYLIKSMFSKEDTPMTFIKNKILAFLVAGILIQMSWFLVGATLDISTVATSAIWAFPASMIADKSKYQWDLRAELEKIRGMSITRDAQADSREKLSTDKTKTPKALDDKASKEELNKYIDAILPSKDSLSWPLLFMWMSLFKFQDFTSTEVIKLGDREKMFITGWIQLLLVVIFTLAMVILFILNVARVVTLWMVIVFIPFFILFKALDIKILDEINFIPKLTTIIKMIFAPVIFTAFMSIMLIFTFAVWGMLNPIQKKTLNEVTFTESSTSTSIAIDQVASSTIEWVKTWFSDLLVYIMLIFLLWVFLKISIGVVWGNDWIVGKVIKPLMDGVWKIPMAMPIIPWWPNGKRMSLSGLQTAAREEKKKIAKKMKWDGTAIEEQRDALRYSLWLSPAWKQEYSTQLTSDIKNSKPTDFFSHSQSYASTLEWLSLQHEQWRPQVEAFLKKADHPSIHLPKMEEETSLEDYFKKNKWAAAAFAKQMWIKSRVNKDNIMTTTFGR